MTNIKLLSVLSEKYNELLESGRWAPGTIICLVPNNIFCEFISHIVNKTGVHTIRKTNGFLLFYGFILIDSDVDEIMFCCEI